LKPLAWYNFQEGNRSIFHVALLESHFVKTLPEIRELVFEITDIKRPVLRYLDRLPYLVGRNDVHLGGNGSMESSEL
jgi:hypothetical protein